ncbi:MAG TPA: hypothetical protein PK961_09265 [bacterium]|nr:hypothetical protein [bacterium]
MDKVKIYTLLAMVGLFSLVILVWIFQKKLQPVGKWINRIIGLPVDLEIFIDKWFRKKFAEAHRPEIEQLLATGHADKPTRIFFTEWQYRLKHFLAWLLGALFFCMITFLFKESTGIAPYLFFFGLAALSLIFALSEFRFKSIIVISPVAIYSVEKSRGALVVDEIMLLENVNRVVGMREMPSLENIAHFEFVDATNKKSFFVSHPNSLKDLQGLAFPVYLQKFWRL